MQIRYKELLITDEMNIAREAKERGEYVVLGYPVQGMTEQDSFSDYPYAIEMTEEVLQLADSDTAEQLPIHSYLNHILCRFRGEPCHILDTERCSVREITPEDVDRLYEIYADPQITEFMENLYEKREDEIAYTKDYIRCHYGFYDFGMWIVEEKKSGLIIGRAGFDMREGYEDPELGFMICRDYQRKGYATEICRALLVYGKEQLGFETVGSFTDPANKASVTLLEKLGFVYQCEKVVNSVKEDGRKLAYYAKEL